MILRLADPAEPDELAAVGELTVAAYVADGYLRGAEDGYAEQLRAADERAREADLVVAVDEPKGTLLGTVTFCRAGTPWAEVSRPGEAEFRMLAVAPEARGRGRRCGTGPAGAWTGPESDGLHRQSCSARCRRCTRRTGCTSGWASSGRPTGTGDPTPRCT